MSSLTLADINSAKLYIICGLHISSLEDLKRLAITAESVAWQMVKKPFMVSFTYDASDQILKDKIKSAMLEMKKKDPFFVPIDATVIGPKFSETELLDMIAGGLIARENPGVDATSLLQENSGTVSLADEKLVDPWVTFVRAGDIIHPVRVLTCLEVIKGLSTITDISVKGIAHIQRSYIDKETHTFWRNLDKTILDKNKQLSAGINGYTEFIMQATWVCSAVKRIDPSIRRLDSSHLLLTKSFIKDRRVICPCVNLGEGSVGAVEVPYTEGSEEKKATLSVVRWEYCYNEPLVPKKITPYEVKLDLESPVLSKWKDHIFHHMLCMLMDGSMFDNIPVLTDSLKRLVPRAASAITTKFVKKLRRTPEMRLAWPQL